MKVRLIYDKYRGLFPLLATKALFMEKINPSQIYNSHRKERQVRLNRIWVGLRIGLEELGARKN
jgi:hypothetical protein